MDMTFKFAIGEQVLVVPSARPGKVVGNYVDRDLKAWTQVQYADTTGKVNTDYFREEDINSTEPAKT